jgi:hypothetical protein
MSTSLTCLFGMPNLTQAGETVKRLPLIGTHAYIFAKRVERADYDYYDHPNLRHP